MKKQPPKPYFEAAHYSHRQNIHGLLMIIVFIAAMVMAFSCRAPRVACPNMAELKSGKYDHQYGWLKCHETSIVTVFDLKGQTVCTYTDSK